METYTIGVDPDIDKNGVATLIKIDGNKKLILQNMRFFELYDFLRSKKEVIDIVIIEGGWLNSKSSFMDKRNPKINAKIGKNVGANHEVGRKIVEMCDYVGIPHEVVKPLIKIWKGYNRKITHKELELQTGFKLGKTNQEQRDAAMLIIDKIKNNYR